MSKKILTNINCERLYIIVNDYDIDDKYDYIIIALLDINLLDANVLIIDKSRINYINTHKSNIDELHIKCISENVLLNFFQYLDRDFYTFLDIIIKHKCKIYIEDEHITYDKIKYIYILKIVSIINHNLYLLEI